MNKYKWKLKDAQKGDIITSGQIVLIFKEWESNTDWNFIIAFAGLDITGNLQITDGHWLMSNYDARLATLEERNKLIDSLHKAGYSWDIENKILLKEE